MINHRYFKPNNSLSQKESDPWLQFLTDIIKVKKPQSITESEILLINEWVRTHVKSNFQSNELSDIKIVILHYQKLNTQLPLNTICDPVLNVTTLHAAAKLGFDVFIKKTRSHKTDWNVKNKNGNTPLHLAAAESEEGTIKYLLQEGADPNLANAFHKLPIYFTLNSGKTHSEVGKKSIAVLLKATTGSALELQDSSVQPPLLHQIVNIDDDSSLNFLVQALDCAPKLRFSKDESGRNILHWAILSRKYHIINYFQKDIELAKELTSDGSNIMHLAYQLEDPEMKIYITHFCEQLFEPSENSRIQHAKNLELKTPADIGEHPFLSNSMYPPG